MPELPEVETVRRGLEPVMTGVAIVRVEQRRPDLRFPFPENFPERLQGRTITALSRRAKYLLADLDDGQVLVMHLGMSGRFLITAGGAEGVPGAFHASIENIPAHDHVVFHLANDTIVTYNDVRRFGFMLLLPRNTLQAHPLFQGIGIEPLGNELDGPLLASFFSGRRTPLKAALLDQRLIAGLGNIYVCETLYRAGLSPFRAAGSLSAEEAERLAETIRVVLAEAIAAGGSTLRDYAHADGSLGYFQHAFRVYDREGASCATPDCKGTIARTVQSGRSTFYCPSCQGTSDVGAIAPK